MPLVLTWSAQNHQRQIWWDHVRMIGPFQWRRLHIRITVGVLKQEKTVTVWGRMDLLCMFAQSCPTLLRPKWTVAHQAPLMDLLQVWILEWVKFKKQYFVRFKKGCVWKTQHQTLGWYKVLFLGNKILFLMWTVTLRSPLNGFGTRLETEAASLDQSDLNPSSKRIECFIVTDTISTAVFLVVYDFREQNFSVN